jgi:benzoyl-CoA reductase/2-hydroxyglutaryl-CoA dehydratase subunit BcrC/BadD/HgdB
MMQIEGRAKQIINTSKKFKVDGVIHHSLKFCDTYLYDVPALKKILVENGIPVLFIESDGGLGDINQIRTRIEAFSEMIKN